jgi:hypothetical protein
MKKELKIEVPNDYSAISLRKYLKMHKDMETYKDNEEAITATLLYHLCDLEPGVINRLDTETFGKIKDQIYSFISNNDYELQRFVTIDGVEYGFEPNLSQMAYGAYVDISKYKELTINDDWANVMSILYRPVTKKIGKHLYDIEPYTGKEESDRWFEVNMEVHLGAWFFFINLSTALQNATLNSLIQKEEMPANIKSILQRSGEVINRLSHLPEGSLKE